MLSRSAGTNSSSSNTTGIEGGLLGMSVWAFRCTRVRLHGDEAATGDEETTATCLRFLGVLIELGVIKPLFSTPSKATFLVRDRWAELRFTAALVMSRSCLAEREVVTRAELEEDRGVKNLVNLFGVTGGGRLGFEDLRDLGGLIWPVAGRRGGD
jgi:hypothetical protein